METQKDIKTMIFLHLLLAFYSLAAVCSKIASGSSFLSPKFIVLYGALLFILFGYAIAWQQILKRIPLITAFANKAVTVIWGLLWGLILFDEDISIMKIVGSVVITMGVITVVKSDAE